MGFSLRHRQIRWNSALLSVLTVAAACGGESNKSRSRDGPEAGEGADAGSDGSGGGGGQGGISGSSTAGKSGSGARGGSEDAGASGMSATGGNATAGVGMAGAEIAGAGMAGVGPAGGLGGSEAGGGGANQAGSTSGGGLGGSPCGGYDEPCCPMPCNGDPNRTCYGCSNADSSCGGSGTSVCTRCGREGERCCSGTSGCVDSNLTCALMNTRRACVPCGAPGAPCCAGKACADGCCVYVGGDIEHQCVGRGDTCPVGGACEADGSCTSCGGVGKPCCEHPANTEWCALRATTCMREVTPRTCEPCGELGQPCCQLTEEAFPGARCSSPLQCSSRTCQPAP